MSFWKLQLRVIFKPCTYLPFNLLFTARLAQNSVWIFNKDWMDSILMSNFKLVESFVPTHNHLKCQSFAKWTVQNERPNTKFSIHSIYIKFRIILNRTNQIKHTTTKKHSKINWESMNLLSSETIIIARMKYEGRKNIIHFMKQNFPNQNTTLH